MVKDLKVLRQRRTEGGCFSEFLIAKTPDDVENCAPAARARRLNNQHITLTTASGQSLTSSTIDSLCQFQIGRAMPGSSAATAAAGAVRTPLPQNDNQRRAKRRERNRVAAAKCRKKRQDQMDELSDACQELEESNSTLEQQVQELAEQKEALLQALRDHEIECTGGLELPDFSLVDVDGDVVVDVGMDIGVDPMLSDEDASMEQLLIDSLPPTIDWHRHSDVGATRPAELLLLPPDTPVSTAGGSGTLVTPLSALLTPQPAFMKAEPSL